MVTFCFLEVENMEVAIGRPIPLEKALELLNRENRVAKETEAAMYFTYSISEDESELLQGELTFPIDNFDLFNEIQKDLLDTVDGESEDLQAFILYLEKLFPKKKKRIPTKKERTPKIEKKKKTRKKVMKKQSLISRKKIAIAFFCTVFLTLTVVLGIKMVPQFFADEVPSYQELIDSKDYETAARTYPEKIDDIENYLYQKVLENKTDETMTSLKTFVEKNKTTFGAFDLDILNANYAEAINFYEKNKSSFSGDNSRLELAGYAYLKTDNLELAKDICDQTSSLALEEKIFTYEQLKQAIDEKEKELEELAKGGSKNREKAESVAKEKFALKEELLNL
ncbi:hypothetical protein [Enterococcus gallinarum]|uniref:hypothetical protein n=1 Tax=Enterococcus gallinarum TaxID=1353 RepID=UPI0010745595|nr:hypothetical protein [Enterococcus gallinarum]MBF0825552.1 hypothetical protein [Enterococcus faecalis]MBX8989964.1 hypothetical protein [Escherichia coli]MBF0726212.1 hypothetical protein [Enterococcus gallinarum]MBF0799145.1 hypothetical protein [Enterococcus gallinarum]NYS82313.1 hypothetical protein [Enterococcus gallinarum]